MLRTNFGMHSDCYLGFVSYCHNTESNRTMYYSSLWQGSQSAEFFSDVPGHMKKNTAPVHWSLVFFFVWRGTSQALLTTYTLFFFTVNSFIVI